MLEGGGGGGVVGGGGGGWGGGEEAHSFPQQVIANLNTRKGTDLVLCNVSPLRWLETKFR